MLQKLPKVKNSPAPQVSTDPLSLVDWLLLRLKSVGHSTVLFFGAMFPRSRTEYVFFGSIFVCYFILSMLVYFQSEVIDHFSPGYWGYLGYDNSWYTNIYFSLDSTDGLFLSRHPFIKLFFLPLIIMGHLLTSLAGSRAKLFLYLLFFNAITSLSVLGVFRFLRELLQLSCLRAFLLATLFAMFFSNIILSFTPESFPVSGLILITAIFCAGKAIQSNKSLSFSDWFTWTFWGSGVTVTNGLCTTLLLLLTKGSVATKIRMIFGGIVFFSALYLFYFLIIGGIFLFLPEDKTLSEYLYENYIAYNRNIAPLKYSPISAEYTNFCIHRFWNNSLVGPSLYSGTDPTLAAFPNGYTVPQVAEKTDCLRMIPGILLLLLSGGGMMTAWRYPLIRLPLTLFLFNVALHLVLLFGSQEPHIYAAHWIFIVPMMIGGLYLLVEQYPLLLRIMDTLIILITIIVFILNAQAFLEFLTIAIPYNINKITFPFSPFS